MQYCMYLRKSRADMEAEKHGEGETLLRHEKTLLDLAKRKKINITKVYREVVSGETISARPEMQQLLSEVEQGVWHGVLVMEVERLARGDTIDQGVVARAFQMGNAQIVTPMKTYDPNNEFDEEYFEFGLFMSRREFKTINRRIQRGRIASVKEGKFISSVAPYGYNKVKIKNDKGYTLEINPEQAEVVKMIYNLYTTGELQEDGTFEKLGCVRIARKLDSLGIKPMLKDTWSRASVQDILKNPVYIGKIRWAYRKEIKTVKDNEVIVTRPSSEEYILADGIHEAIISEDIFNKVSKILSGRGLPPVPGNNLLKNSLTGLVYCGKCGTMLTRLAKNKKTPYDALKCPNRYCDNVSSPLYLVEEVLIEELRKWLLDFKAKWSVEKLDMPYSKAIKDKEFAIQQVKTQLDKLDEQRDKTFTFLEQGIYTPEIFTERSKRLADQMGNLKNAVSKFEKERLELKVQEEKNEVFIPKAEHILDIYETLTSASVKNESLKEILEKVEYIKTEPNRRGNRDNTNFKLRIYPKVVKF